MPGGGKEKIACKGNTWENEVPPASPFRVPTMKLVFLNKSYSGREGKKAEDGGINKGRLANEWGRKNKKREDAVEAMKAEIENSVEKVVCRK